jgi:hypothetical protein
MIGDMTTDDPGKHIGLALATAYATGQIPGS